MHMGSLVCHTYLVKQRFPLLRQANREREKQVNEWRRGDRRWEEHLFGNYESCPNCSLSITSHAVIIFFTAVNEPQQKIIRNKSVDHYVSFRLYERLRYLMELDCQHMNTWNTNTRVSSVILASVCCYLLPKILGFATKSITYYLNLGSSFPIPLHQTVCDFSPVPIKWGASWKTVNWVCNDVHLKLSWGCV